MKAQAKIPGYCKNHKHWKPLRISCEYGCGEDVKYRCVRDGALICEVRGKGGFCKPNLKKAAKKLLEGEPRS